MKKNKHMISDSMLLNGGAELSDLQRARLELVETQKRLANKHYIPPEDRAENISRQDAEKQLHDTLYGVMNSEPEDMTLEEARAQLAETQRNMFKRK